MLVEEAMMRVINSSMDLHAAPCLRHPRCSFEYCTFARNGIDEMREARVLGSVLRTEI